MSIIRILFLISVFMYGYMIGMGL